MQETAIHSGLLLNFTGDGKGKSTAAFGTLFRALGWNWRCTVIQFIKNDQPTGEARLAERCFPNQLRWLRYGCGFTFRPHADADADRAAAEAGWREALESMRDPQLQLLILDELNLVLHLRYLPESEVLRALRQRPKTLHVIITGRHAPEALLAASDLVTRMEEVKHPFQQGIPAQRGIDF